MPRNIKAKPRAADRQVMVRVAANLLGREFRCAVPECHGELRIEQVGGYTVEICTKCERRLKLWNALEVRAREAGARVHQLEADRAALQAEVVALREKVAALRATPPAQRAGAKPKPQATPALVIEALKVAGEQLLFGELSALLPPEHQRRLSPTLIEMSRSGRIQTVTLPWGKRYRCAYRLPRAS